MSKILFVSSLHTGYGHRSITEALGEQLAVLDPSVEILEVDGFLLGGKTTAAMSRFYDRLVVTAPWFWKYYYRLGNIFPGVANHFTTKNIEKNFYRLIRENRPNLIVSVHPCFVGSICCLLDKIGCRIPVVSLVADLDNVTRLWADKRAAYTLCPTENARRTMIKYGVPEERIRVFGFPVRDRFNHGDSLSKDMYPGASAGKETVKFLVMNGSQGLGRVARMAGTLLEHFQCKIVILAGNNPEWKAAVEKKLEQYGDRVQVCGFVKNVEEYMAASDLLLIRASPNVMMEAVNLCKPFIVTGSLTGQEERNPEFAVENGLGIVCGRSAKLPDAVRILLDNNGRRIVRITEQQRKFRKLQASLDTARFLLSLL